MNDGRLSMEIEEISQKIEKSLITLIKSRLHRCEMIEKPEIWNHF
jgi:hypothetical protein